MIDIQEVERDIEFIIWSFKLTEINRYVKQRFWEKETLENEYASRIFGFSQDGKMSPRAESVADHSWHIADMTILIAPRFPILKLDKCLLLAILHDKLEIITGDKSPIGKNGKGTNSHAFNIDKKELKERQELYAFDMYMRKLNAESMEIQKDVILDAIKLNSEESRFIKAIDRLQPIVYILKKKDGEMSDDHLLFTLKYTSTFENYFPALRPYYEGLINRLLISVAVKRNSDVEDLRKKFNLEQLRLF